MIETKRYKYKTCFNERALHCLHDDVICVSAKENKGIKNWIGLVAKKRTSTGTNESGKSGLTAVL